MSKLADLATKKFTTKDFEEALARNLEKKKKKETPVETPVETPKDDWKTVDESDWKTVEAQSEATNPEKSLFNKAIDWYNEPQTNFGEQRSEALKNIPQKERIKHTGGQNKLQDFLAEVDAMSGGFRRGAWEGVGRAADMIMTPSTIVGLLGGGLANKLASAGIKGAGAINNLVRGGEATGVIHGGRTMLDPNENVMNRIFGALEAAGSAAGVRYGNLPEAPTVSKPKPKVKVTAKTSPVVEPEVKATQPELPIEPAAEVPLKESSEEMVKRIFPGMERGKSKFDLSKSIKNFVSEEEGSIDLSRLFQGEEDLGYSVRTNDPNAIDIGEVRGEPIDLDQAALEAGEGTAKLVGPIRQFLGDESGEIRFDNQRGKMINESDVVPPPEKGEFELPHEFAPELMQQADEAFGGYSPRFEARTPSPDIEPLPSMFDRLKQTMVDESGSVPREPEVKKYDMQGRLVKKTGERISPEDARIQKLTDDAMRAAEAERKTMLRSGETELTPEELESFRTKMQSGEQFAEEVQASPARENMPLLRSKDYIPGQGESAKSANRREAGFFGDRTSFKENPLEVKPEGFAEKTKRFLADEKGEIDLSGLLGDEPIPGPKMGAKSDLLHSEELTPDLPITKRAQKPEEQPGMLRQIVDAPMGAMSVDLPFISSAAFRQASPLAWTKAWGESWVKAAKAYGSEGAYDATMKEIMDSKLFKPRYQPSHNAKGEITGYKEKASIAEDLGLKMSDLKNFSRREEVSRSMLAEKLPGGWGDLIKRSNRAYSAFLNWTRAKTLEKLISEQKWAGNENDVTIAKGLAEFINDATGRGSLKFQGPKGSQLNLERSAPFVRNALWSPRLLASRLKFLNPYTYTNAPPEVRQQYINGLMRSAGTWLGFAGLAKMGGAEVNTDPTNADFGKIKIGDTRIDPGAGFQQLLVLAARESPKAVGEQFGFDTGHFTSSATGKSQEYGKGFRPKDRISVFEDFAASKLHPTYKLAYDLMRASSDRPVHVGDRIVQMTLPIMAQDIMDAAKTDPELAAILGPLSSVGMGTSTYGRGDRMSDPVFTDSIEQALGQQPGSLRGTITKW